MLSFYRNQNLCDRTSEATWTWQSYPLHVFCWFQRNKNNITIVPARARFVYNRDRAVVTEEIETSRLSGTVNIQMRIKEIFFPKMYSIPDRHLRMTHKSAQSYLKVVCRICPASINQPLPLASGNSAVIKWQSSVPGIQTPLYTGMPLE